MADNIMSTILIYFEKDILNLKGVNTKDKRYNKIIIAVVQNQLGMDRGGKKGMKNRMLSIMDTRQKKIGVTIICLILIGVIMAGTSFTSVADKEPANASESNIPLSNREIEIQDQKSKKETAKRYSIYSKYGLTYDQEKDRFFYNGRLVRFFADKLDEDGSYTSFSYTEGTVDLRGIRNSKYELVGVEPVSQEEYDQRTAKIKTSSKNMSGAVQESVGDSLRKDDVIIEVDPTYVDDSLNSYIRYGVSYDKEKKVWMYKDRQINFLYDEGYITFIDYSEAALQNGISLKVIRDIKGRIDKLIEVAE